MKAKLLISALLIAAFAAISLSSIALADGGTTSTPSPTPVCKPLDSNTTNEILLCKGRLTVEVQKQAGISVSLVPAPESLKLPNAPKVSFVGPATIIKVVDSKGQPVKAAFMQVCFKDTVQGNVFRWWTSADWKTWYNTNEGARWVYSPTYRSITGYSCTNSWLPGIFTIN